MQNEIRKEVEKQNGIITISFLIKEYSRAIIRAYNQIKSNGLTKEWCSAVIKVMTNKSGKDELNRNLKGCAHLLIKPFTTGLDTDDSGHNMIQWDNPIYCYLLSPRIKFIKYGKDRKPVECFSVRKDLLRNIKASIDNGEVLNYEFVYFHGEKFNQPDSMYRIPFDFLWDRYVNVQDIILDDVVKSAEEKDYLFTRLSAIEDYKVNFNNDELPKELKNQKAFYNKGDGFDVEQYLTNGYKYLGTCRYSEYITGLNVFIGFYQDNKRISEVVKFKSMGELYDFLKEKCKYSKSKRTLERSVKAKRTIILENGMVIKASDNKDDIKEDIEPCTKREEIRKDEKVIAVVEVNLSDEELEEQAFDYDIRRIKEFNNMKPKSIEPDTCYFPFQNQAEAEVDKLASRVEDKIYKKDFYVEGEPLF